ncbi:YbhB/YbcL family Raf kinase inhibitor-like protein [Candidatus Woesearchaeota archaeon]|nr:MAG: YbhB/YbcL family Raf kinase inhibitor-like protein [Candidatus Woesearchaeota archaeon]
MKYFLLMVMLLLLTACSQNVQKQNEPIIMEVSNMKITSPVFENNGDIPSKYTCDGKDVNPELVIEDVPENAKTLALIVDDPDAPAGTWVHWVVWNIPKDIGKIEEDSVPGIEGMNDFRKNSYGGPCPPSGKHRYYFKLYALDAMLNLDASATKKDLELAMQGHILAKAEIVGLYSRV